MITTPDILVPSLMLALIVGEYLLCSTNVRPSVSLPVTWLTGILIGFLSPHLTIAVWLWLSAALGILIGTRRRKRMQNAS